MKKTICICDKCREEVERLFTIDVENPLMTEGGTIGRMFDIVPFGRLTSDGMWEMELCLSCLTKSWRRLADESDSSQ